MGGALCGVGGVGGKRGSGGGSGGAGDVEGEGKGKGKKDWGRERGMLSGRERGAFERHECFLVIDSITYSVGGFFFCNKKQRAVCLV